MICSNCYSLEGKTHFIFITKWFFILVLFVFIQCCANANIVIRGNFIREYQASPGERYQENITLVNQGGNPKEVKIYFTDYLYTYQGESYYPQPAGQTERSNANWITFYPSFLIIPPYETSNICCTIKIPLDETLQGTYWSMLMVEEILDGDSHDEKRKHMPAKDTDPEENPFHQVFVDVHQVMRYGIQMITHIGDTGKKEITILDQRLIPGNSQNSGDTMQEEEPYILQLDIQNSGERSLQPATRVEIYDNEKACLVNCFKGKKYLIYPGLSTRYQIELNLLPKQTYQVLVILDSGDEGIWGAQYTIEL